MFDITAKDGTSKADADVLRERWLCRTPAQSGGTKDMFTENGRWGGRDRGWQTYSKIYHHTTQSLLLTYMGRMSSLFKVLHSQIKRNCKQQVLDQKD